ncbi:MAG: UDP-glucose--hexose-1-phosphate uridylyltransferase [Acidobacteriota bacterium]|nr:UDP-glucose--hexose-1-phosphate uridylyltransferase [Acidobacteriota bacterium]
MNWNERPHRRLNPLTREWVLVSPQRTDRPWQGQVEKTARPVDVEYDPKCYLCPGNSRAGGAANPPYTSTFVFDNDYAALRPDTPESVFDQGGLLVARAEKGICRVVCFSPNHSLTVARMSVPALRRVVDEWVAQFRELGAMPFINNVQIFENRGEMMGASNPHPHCQIWANESLPNEIIKEQSAQVDYFHAHNSCLLCDYLKLELASRERIVCENDSFAAIVPFWAVWPFETIVISKTHVNSIDGLQDAARDALADILKRLTARYDNLFEVSFPYTMGFHQHPADGAAHPEWHLHAHFYPPLLRSATVRKFMVGYEMLGMPQRDITAESAAARLRDLPEKHYLES